MDGWETQTGERSDQVIAGETRADAQRQAVRQAGGQVHTCPLTCAAKRPHGMEIWEWGRGAGGSALCGF